MASKFADDFLRQGYVIFDIENDTQLKYVQGKVLDALGSVIGDIDLEDLQSIHRRLTPEEVNQVRVKTYQMINSSEDFTEAYFRVFEKAVTEIVGSELACQTKVNFSIQMPQDDTSLLALHTDTVGGQSKFEVVGWLPLTDAFDTNAMYVFSLEDSQQMVDAMPKYHKLGMARLLEDYDEKKTFLELKRGQGLLFSSNLMHGNVLNTTPQSRLSLNSRYKSLFSPYNSLPHSEKRLGNFYRPLRISPATSLALSVNEPTDEFKDG